MTPEVRAQKFHTYDTLRASSPFRGGEWYLNKRGSRKILAGSRNLGNVFGKSRSLVFAWFVFTFFESRNFLPKSLGLGFLARISASRRVSDFTIRHPSIWVVARSHVRASFLRRHFAGKPVVASRNVDCFLRLQTIRFLSLITGGALSLQEHHNWC